MLICRGDRQEEKEERLIYPDASVVFFFFFNLCEIYVATVYQPRSFQVPGQIAKGWQPKGSLITSSRDEACK